MVSTLQQTFESGTNGASVTTGNSAGGGAPVSGIVTGAATVTYTSTAGEVIDGALSAECTAAAAEAAYVNMAATAAAGGFFAKHRWAGAPSQNTAVHIVRGTSKLCQVQLRTDGKLQFENSNASTTYVTPSALSFPGVYGLDVAFDSGTSTSDGRLTFAVYDSGGALAGGLSAPYEMTGTNAGAGIASANLQAGKANASTDTRAYYVDGFRAVLGAYALAGPDAPPVADAGADQTGVEPGATVTLDGTGSSAVATGATITGYAWTQTAGTSVTLDDDTAAQPTFTAPPTLAGDTLTFSLTVTDSGSTDSNTADAVGVTVLPSTIRVVVGGVQVAAYLRIAS